MRVVLYTNVFISGVFFIGPPHEILKAWRDGKLQLILSADILDEYHRVAETLAEQYPEVDLDPIIELLAVEADVISVPALREAVCQDPEDDKFLACALAANARVVISGDKHLLKANGYGGIEVMRPREFMERYLRKWSEG